MKKIIISVSFILLVLAVLFFVGVIKINQPSSNKIKVVTTLFPLYDIAKSIGGDKLDVSLLLPPGVEAHSFEPKPSDVIKINQAGIFIFTGDVMEPWASDIVKSLTDNSISIVNASKGITLLKEGASDGQGMDPHFWLDFTNMIKITRSIGDAITLKDPANTSYYKTNIDTYIATLKRLDSDYRDGLSKCSTKTFVYAGHYAFGYLAKRYRLNFVSAYGAAPDAEPSAQDIVSLIDKVKNENIKYIFYEELVSPQLAQTLVDETGTKMLQLNPAHNISKDDYSNNATFDSIMKYNLENLKTGLQCQ